jgi:ribosomal protein S27E
MFLAKLACGARTSYFSILIEKMNHLYEIAVGAYLLIGLLLGIVGLGGKEISNEVKRARGSEFTNALTEKNPPSEFKLMLFRVIATAAFILAWPIFTYSIMKEQSRQLDLEKTLEEKSKGLWFSYIGGCGKIRCKDCDHSESITSFIHGINSSSTGFQCQSCGKLTSIKSGGPGRANEYEESLECECGGKLDRDKVIFCPSCKSENLIYQMEFIT